MEHDFAQVHILWHIFFKKGAGGLRGDGSETFVASYLCSIW